MRILTPLPDSCPIHKNYHQQYTRFYSLIRCFFLLVGSMGAFCAGIFFLVIGPFQVTWSSGILWSSCIIFRQYFWKTLSLASSVLRNSPMISCKSLKRPYASSAQPPYFCWPSFVRVHFASYFEASAPVRGILAPVIYKRQLVNTSI